MKDPTTLDELYGLMHSHGSLLGSMGGGRWANKNFYPGSEDAKFAEWTAEHAGKLATEVPLCPFHELVRDCALLAGIDPETLPEAQHFCGYMIPERHGTHDWSAHGPRDEPYASCQGVVVLLSDQLRRANTKRPSKAKLETVLELPADERDKILAQLDAATEGAQLREDFVKRASQLVGEVGLGKREALRVVEAQMRKLRKSALGADDATSTFYFFNKGGCPAAPERR